MVNNKINELYNSIENMENKIIDLNNEKEECTNNVNKFIYKTNEIMLIFVILVFFVSIGIGINTSVLYAMISYVISTIVGFSARTIMNKRFKLKEKQNNITMIKSKITEYEKVKKDLIKELEKINNENNQEVVVDLDNKLNNIRKEKEDLIKLKELLNQEGKLIDITDVYVYEPNDDNVKYLVKLEDRHYLKTSVYFTSHLIDIFSNNELYKEVCKFDSIKIKGMNKLFGKITPLHKYEPAILAYPDKLVPEYILRQIYYNINNINLDAPILRKKKEK